MGGFALYDAEQEQPHFLGILWDNDNPEDDEKIFKQDVVNRIRALATQGDNQVDTTQDNKKQTNTDEDPGVWEVTSSRYYTLVPPPVQSVPGQPCLLEILVSKGFIDINTEEVTALGEADVLGKFIAFIEVMWFTLQCIARRVEGLAFAEFEVITLAHAVILGVSYRFWWHKPLRVRNGL
ncbi:hypothetical protein VNI00_016596 [Paramarasmius palmivorus]|uniref:Uncharacterized protein n=1 Tax=Paramarasmius palmivorus TaxID=297713 RepID=A0AAW0BC02_9AGAR